MVTQMCGRTTSYSERMTQPSRDLLSSSSREPYRFGHVFGQSKKNHLLWPVIVLRYANRCCDNVKTAFPLACPRTSHNNSIRFSFTHCTTESLFQSCVYARILPRNVLCYMWDFPDFLHLPACLCEPASVREHYNLAPW